MIRMLFFLLLCSCSQDDEIKVYRLAKDHSAPDHGIAWRGPVGWEERAASGMRAATFYVQGKGEKDVDISLTFLSGVAGGDLPNVNRWRDQIQLPSWSPEAFAQHVQKQETLLGPAKIVDFSNGETRIVAAIIPYKSGTWFVKMLGVPQLVEEQKPQLLQFLKTLQPTG